VDWFKHTKTRKVDGGILWCAQSESAARGWGGV
jgi:hypothetical protein